MSTTSRISWDLHITAKESAKIHGRTVAAQVEHWAFLGAFVERVLTGGESALLKSSKDITKVSAFEWPTRARLLEKIGARCPCCTRINGEDFGCSLPVSHPNQPCEWIKTKAKP